MKTRCPECQTIFRVTPEQLKARAGKVRCGHCRTVFDAFESLFEEAPPGAVEAHAEPVRQEVRDEAEIAETPPDIPAPPAANEPDIQESPEFPESGGDGLFLPDDTLPEPDEMPAEAGPPPMEPVAVARAPRETIELSGLGGWDAGGDEGIMAPPIGMYTEKPVRWPFHLAAVALALTLFGQIVFHFRGELAISAPALRPALEAFSLALDGPLPLPRHNEQVSIETSDLQIDPARGNLLVLNATLRNKASYGQAYPSLELSLTDTQDAVIARRTFEPPDYLPASTVSGGVFRGYSDTSVRLWIEAAGLKAAGYRLLVFYP
jgi:predicted Zn finger-like uncharacterized protein